MTLSIGAKSVSSFAGGVQVEVIFGGDGGGGTADGCGGGGGGRGRERDGIGFY